MIPTARGRIGTQTWFGDYSMRDTHNAVSSDLAALTVGDLLGQHGHLEDFEPEPLCAGRLADLLPVQRCYRFVDQP